MRNVNAFPECPEELMRKTCFIAVIVWICLSTIAAFSQAQDGLWPKSEPYRTGYLRVSPRHEIFFQLGGTPQGMPVMVLHGGPGAGCWPRISAISIPGNSMSCSMTSVAAA